MIDSEAIAAITSPTRRSPAADTVSNAYNCRTSSPRAAEGPPAGRARLLRARPDGPRPARGATGSLGLAFDQPLTYAFTDPAAALFLQGMALGLEEHGLALSLIPRMPEGASRSAELVRSALVDGYILFCTAGDDERVRAVRARGLPFVLVEGADHPTMAHVQIDDIAGAEAAARHVTGLGHRGVAIVSPYANGVVSGPEAQETSSPWRTSSGRLEGWRDVEAAGVDWSTVPVSGAAAPTSSAARAPPPRCSTAPTGRRRSSRSPTSRPWA